MEHNMNHIMNHGMDHGMDHQEHEWKSNNQIISNATHFMENQDHLNVNKEAMRTLENHAHGADHAHSGHSMAMTFHGGYVETILFSWWNVKEIGGFIGSFVAIFIMALLYEGLKYYRKHLLWKTYTGLQYCAVAPPDKGVSNLCAADEPQVLQLSICVD